MAFRGKRYVWSGLLICLSLHNTIRCEATLYVKVTHGTHFPTALYFFLHGVCSGFAYYSHSQAEKGMGNPKQNLVTPDGATTNVVNLLTEDGNNWPFLFQNVEYEQIVLDYRKVDSDSVLGGRNFLTAKRVQQWNQLFR